MLEQIEKHIIFLDKEKKHIYGWKKNSNIVKISIIPKLLYTFNAM